MLEKFEKKILELKQKIDRKYIGVTMFAIFGLMTVLALNYVNYYIRERRTSSDMYNKSMYEIITNVNNIDNLVSKLRVTTTNEYNISTVAEIMAEANSAKDNLSTLPLEQEVTKNSSKFLSQVIGYSEALLKKLAENKNLDKEDYENLEKINNVAASLDNSLSKIYTKLSKTSIDWGKVKNLARENLDKEDNLKLTGIGNIENSLEDYEGLIYDGAYSSHIEQKKPKLLQDLKEVTKEEAKKKAIKCVENIDIYSKNKLDIEDVIYKEISKGKLELYMFEVSLKNLDYKIDVSITKKGGMLAMLLLNRKVTNKSIDINKAKEIGDNYLKSLGLEEFSPTYYLESQNMITINYAATQNKVVLYPDLIKVKIAEDTGEVCSVECTGYIYNHHVRNNLETLITKEQALKSVNNNLKVEDIKLAIIPTDSKKEILTYEIKGSINDKTFLIYVDANTGKEVEALILLKTKGGTLTI